MVMHAGYDFLRLESGDFLFTGKTFQWNNKGGIFAQRLNILGESLWHYIPDTAIYKDGTGRQILKLADGLNFQVVGTYVSYSSFYGKTPLTFKIDTNGVVNNLHAISTRVRRLPVGPLGSASFNAALISSSGNVYSAGAIYLNRPFADNLPVGFLHKHDPNSAVKSEWMTYFSRIPFPLLHEFPETHAVEQDFINCPDMDWDPADCTFAFARIAEHFRDLVQLPNGDIVMGGSTVINYFGYPPYGGINVKRDAWLVKVDSNGCEGNVCGTISSLKPIQKDAFGMKVYPNPTHSTIHVVWDEGIKVKQLQVFDMLGRTVYQQQVFGKEALLDAALWPIGVYVLHLMDEKGNTAHIKVSRN